jgi:hypothetical protein
MLPETAAKIKHPPPPAMAAIKSCLAEQGGCGFSVITVVSTAVVSGAGRARLSAKPR